MVALDSAIPPLVLLLSKQLVNRVVAGTGLTTALLAVVVGLGLASGLERAMSAVRNHWQDIFSQRVQQAATVRFLGQAGTIDLGHLDQRRRAGSGGVPVTLRPTPFSAFVKELP